MGSGLWSAGFVRLGDEFISAVIPAAVYSAGGHQALAEYLRLALVFMLRGALREGFNFCFSGFLLVFAVGTGLSFYGVEKLP